MTEAPVTHCQIEFTGFATGPVLLRATYLMQRLHTGQLVPMPLTLTNPESVAALAEHEEKGK